MSGKQRYYSLTLSDGRIITFESEQARDEWLRSGTGGQEIERNKCSAKKDEEE